MVGLCHYNACPDPSLVRWDFACHQCHQTDRQSSGDIDLHDDVPGCIGSRCAGQLFHSCSHPLETLIPVALKGLIRSFGGWNHRGFHSLAFDRSQSTGFCLDCNCFLLRYFPGTSDASWFLSIFDSLQCDSQNATIRGITIR